MKARFHAVSTVAHQLSSSGHSFHQDSHWWDQETEERNRWPMEKQTKVLTTNQIKPIVLHSFCIDWITYDNRMKCVEFSFQLITQFSLWYLFCLDEDLVGQDLGNETHPPTSGTAVWNSQRGRLSFVVSQQTLWRTRWEDGALILVERGMFCFLWLLTWQLCHDCLSE